MPLRAAPQSSLSTALLSPYKRASAAIIVGALVRIRPMSERNQGLRRLRVELGFRLDCRIC